MAVLPNAIAATGILTLTGLPLDTETVTIDAKVYTFQTVLTDVDGNVLIGATASDSIDNLIAAIGLGAGSGTTYAASMTLHPTASAAAGAGDTMVATGKVSDETSKVASTETLTNGSWGAANFAYDLATTHGQVESALTTIRTTSQVNSDVITDLLLVEAAVLAINQNP